MSTFWHKMSNLKPVCSIKMWKLTEKSHFCALYVMFLRLVSILKWKVFFKAMLSAKTQWGVMSTFWHKMSNLKPVCPIKMLKLTEKSHFCALYVMFLRLVSILKWEGLLQEYVKCKNTMRSNVNFLLSVMFFRLVSILTLEGLLQGCVKWKNTMTGNVNFLTQNVKSETSLLD